ncbi:hypothetical protein SD80_018205 [Scytonema tolypothrichoides VB-61278]|nr:hypothetical protein SD80_018205 [Scytonema tolypothrichoides VB-61278]
MPENKSNDNYEVTQKGIAENLIQVGRDYIRNIRINVSAGNWLMVSILVIPLIIISFLGIKSVESLASAITSTLSSHNQNLSQEKAERIAQKWLDSVSLDSKGTTATIKQVAGVRIDESSNTAEAQLSLGAQQGGQSLPRLLPGTAYFTRYSDGTWAMTKFTIHTGDILFEPSWTMNVKE